jgi:hypothetical protein
MTSRTKKHRTGTTGLTSCGQKVRSLTEAKTLVALEAAGVKWEYEPKRFKLTVPVTYVPDLYLAKYKLWVEVKGTLTSDDCKKALAFSKVKPNYLFVLQKPNAKMWGRKTTNETWLKRNNIDYCYVATLEQYLKDN